MFLVVNVVVVLTKLQTKQVFFPYGSHVPPSLSLSNMDLTKYSSRFLPFRNPTTGTLYWELMINVVPPLYS